MKKWQLSLFTALTVLNMRGHIFEVTSNAAEPCSYSKSRWFDPCVQTLTISLMPRIHLEGYTGSPREEMKLPRPVQNEVPLRRVHKINARETLAPGATCSWHRTSVLL